MARARRKTPEQEATKLARKILPAAQVLNGRFEVRDVANHSDGDQRHMTRSGERRTIRRMSKIDMLLKAGTISLADAKACEWYQATHELAFETTGITADYERSGGGGGDGVMTLLARYRDQMEARTDFQYARAGISPFLVHLFEKVVLHGRPMGKLSLSFRLAARQLRERMPHLFEVG